MRFPFALSALLALLAVVPSAQAQRALSLDGVSGALATASAPDLGTAFTAEAWVYVRGTDHGALLGQAGSFDLLVLGDGRLEYNGASGHLASPAGAVGRSVWHHVAVAYDASASPAMRILVDGAVVASADTGVEGGSLAPGTSASPLYVGQRPVSTPLYLHGEIDELRVWSEARTTAQIAGGAARPLVGNEDGLALHYRFEVLRNLLVARDGADDVQDHSGNERHADARGGASLVASTAPIQPARVQASDDVFEQLVEVSWQADEVAGQVVQVLRDGKLLASVSGRDTRYADATGDPFTPYTYCVVTQPPGGARSVLGCDVGRRRLKAAEDVAASDALFDDRVRLTWRDRSGYETGYQVWRDGAKIATTAAGFVTYDDETATLAGSPYRYCVVPEVDGVAGTVAACDDGAVGATLPVTDVAASDGTYPNAVLITWADQGEGATSFRIFRSGTYLHDVNLSAPATASDTRYEDRTATPGEVYNYCIRRFQGASAGVDRCNTGSIGTLAVPGDVAATDGAFDDRVRVTWTDRSGDEAGYRVTRRGGSALAFDGTDDYLVVSDTEALDLRYTFTIEAWVRPDGGGYIVTKDGIGTDLTGSYNVSVTGSGALDYETNNQGSVRSASGVVPAGVWTHIAATFDDSDGDGTGAIRLYANGALVRQGTASTPRDLATDLLVGRRGVGTYFGGEIDELRLWGVVRSEAELRASLFTTLSGDEPGLRAYYPFDEGTGTLARDAYGIATLGFPGDAVRRPAWTTETAPFAQHGSGLALALDGTDDYAEVAAAAAPALGAAFTLEAWVYPTADQHATILSTDDGLSGAALFRVLSGGRLSYETRGTSSATAPSGTVPLGQWSHVAVVREDAASDNTRLYVGGVLVALGTTSAPSGQRAVQIGRMSTGQHFAGRIDELRVWTNTRSASEIAAARYALPAGATLAARYHFDALATGAGGALDITEDAAGSADARVVGAWLGQGPSVLLTETAAGGRSATDRDAQPGVAQTYCVTTFTAQGAETAPVCDAGHRARAQQPTAVAATDDTFEDRIRVTWTSASSRAAFFKLYRDGALLQTLPAATLQYEDDAIASGRAYRYCLATVSSEGAESPQVCDEGSRLLAAPTRVDASDEGEENSVTITWADESEVERGYLVYRRAVLEGGALAADSVRVDSLSASVTTVKDRAGVAGVLYHYSVTAVDTYGQSASPSDRGSRILAAPTDLAAEDGASETSVRLTWTDVSTLETGYRVYRDGELLAGDLAANANAYTDTEPRLGVSANYAVEAFQGEGGALGASMRAEDAGRTTLLPPGTVVASDDQEDAIHLAWVDQSAVESGYVLLRDGVPFQYERTDRSAAADAKSNPVQGTRYTYCLRTWIDGDGDGYPWTARFGALDAGDTFSEEACDTGLRPAPVATPAPNSRIFAHSVGEANPAETSRFGEVVRVAGDQMFVGAPEENGQRGAVYVYERTASGWTQSERLAASDGMDGALFGSSLDASGDWLVIGAFRHRNDYGRDGGACSETSDFGRVYWFERTTDGWVERQRLTHSNLNCRSSYGFAVSVDGAWSMVGALNDGAGSIYIYRLDGAQWVSVSAISGRGHDVGVTTDYGAQVAISDDVALVTAPRRSGLNDPRVIVLKRTGDVWAETDYNGLTVEGQNQPTQTGFGFAMDKAGRIVAVGARGFDRDGVDNAGIVRIFRYDADDKLRIATTIAPPAEANGWFGSSVSLDDEHLLVGASGKAYLYSYTLDGTAFSYDLVATYSAAEPSTDADGSIMLGRAVHTSGGDIVVGDNAKHLVYFDEVNPVAPANVTATDGTFQNRAEITWSDVASNEDEYHVFRDDQPDAIAVLPAGTTTYIDLDALPGEVHEYCVQAVRTVYDDRSDRACDLGWRAPDGVIQGQIRASLGGTVTGIEVCLAPAPNGAVLLDGITHSLVTPDAVALGDNMTVEFWAKLSAGQGGQERVLLYHDASTIELGYRSDGRLQYTFAGARGGERTILMADPAGVWNPHEWTHYAIRYRDSDNMTTVFVNGNVVAETIAAVDYDGSAQGRFWLGQYVEGRLPVAGQIDEVRVWSTAVNVEDIVARRFRTPTAAERLAMTAYWPLDERHSNTFANEASAEGALYLRGTSSAAPSRPGAPLEACALSDEAGSFGFEGLRYGESTAFTVTPRDPGGAPKIFRPATRTVTLSRENPVQNEIELVDMTSYTISGHVLHEGPDPDGGTLLTECPLDGAQVIVGGQANEPVDSAGRFRASAPQGSEPVEVYIAPEREDFVLSPERLSFVPSADSLGVVVRQTMQRRLDLSFAGGACAFDMGTATVTVRAESGCFETEVAVGKGGTALYLPPLDYTVQVTDVQHDDPTQRAAMLEYFAATGGQPVSLLDSNQVVPLRYIGPLQVAIADLSSSLQCTAGDVRDVPVLVPGAVLDLTVSVAEDYGAAGTCPSGAATVLLYNEIADRETVADTLFIAEDSGGSVSVPLDIGAPNLVRGRIVDGVDRSYQKHVTAIAEVGGRSATATQWAVVEGSASRPGEQFVTLPSAPTPLWVLRDPPGDASYSYLEAGASTCLSMSKSTGLNFALGPELEMVFGTSVDVGAAFFGEGSLEYQLGAGFTFGYRYGQSETKTDAIDLCFETNEVIETSGDSDFIGAGADVFVGAGVNLVFAKADHLNVDVAEGGVCTLELTETIAMRPEVNNMFVHTRSHIQDTLIPRLDSVAVQAPEQEQRDAARAGIGHWNRMLIESDLVKYAVNEPFARQAGTARLELDLTAATIAAAGDVASADEQAAVLEGRLGGLLPSGLPSSSGIGQQLGEAIVSGETQSIDLGRVTDLSQAEVQDMMREARARRLPLGLATLPDTTRRTISYDAGSVYAYSYTHTFDHAYSQELEQGHAFSGSIYAYVSTALILPPLGMVVGNATFLIPYVGPPLAVAFGAITAAAAPIALGLTEPSQLGFEYEVEMVTAYGFDMTWSEGTTVGYVLSDDDQDDSFLVHVLMDPIYGTPIFDVVGGYASCPYEPWESLPFIQDGVDFSDFENVAPRVVPRDAPKLRVDAPKLSGLAPDEAAVFTLFMENGSPSEEARAYRLQLLNPSNPYGAVLRAGGNTLGGLDYVIEAGQTQELALTVERGPRRYTYDNLALSLAPQCEAEAASIDQASIADTAYVSVDFAAPCSDVDLRLPRADWTLAQADEGRIEVLMAGLDLEPNDQGSGLAQVAVEYRQAGTDDAWTFAFATPLDTILVQNGLPNGTRTPSDLRAATAYGHTWTFPTSLSDGTYEVRVVTECRIGETVSGRNYSAPAPGLVDRAAPQVLGTPSPRDRFLEVGDDVALAFDEPLDCGSLRTSGDAPNVTLRRADTGVPIPVRTVCDGKRVVIAPQDPNAWAALEGIELAAHVESATDLAGNPMEEAAAWSFVVRRSAFGFALADVGIDVPLGQPGRFEVPLANGRTSEVAFEVTSLPGWLFASPMQGTLQPGAALDIAFQVAAFDTVGLVRDTVEVTSAAGLIRLPVETDVRCAPVGWQVDPAAYLATMSVTAQVYVDGVALDDARDMLAAFVGDEIRGVTSIAPQSGGNRASLVVYANPADAAERVRFEVFDASTCRSYGQTSKSLLFEEDAVFGTPTQPVAIHAGDAPGGGLVALSAGWTWISTNRAQDDMRVSVLLADLDAGPQDLVKSQTAFSVYDASAGWVGSLTSLAPGDGYLVYLGQSQGLALAGMPVDPAATPISLGAGWNWIGYTPQSSQPLGEALAGLSPASGDLIKSQTAFSQYADGLGWVGALDELAPGVGYQMRVATAQTLTFAEPAPSVAAARVASASQADRERGPSAKQEREPARESARETKPLSMPSKTAALESADGPEGWTVSPADFPHTQSVVARAVLGGEPLASEGALLAAFAPDGAGGEACRGVATVQMVGDEALFFLTTYGTAPTGETLTLRFYDPATNAEVTALPALDFVADGLVGSVGDPFVARDAASTSVEDEIPEAFALESAYPNPFRTATRLSYALPSAERVRLVLFDLLGREVQVLVDAAQPPGRYHVDLPARGLASGVYLYRIEAGEHEAVKRVVLVK